MLNRELNRAARKNVDSKQDLIFLYPFGASLNVQKPAIPILSSGTVSYPLNQPVAAVHQSSNTSGKLMVVGSVQMFSDVYIDKEENGQLFDVIIRYLTSGNNSLTR